MVLDDLMSDVVKSIDMQNVFTMRVSPQQSYRDLPESEYVLSGKVQQNIKSEHSIFISIEMSPRSNAIILTRKTNRCWKIIERSLRRRYE